ncbi:MAG: bifunctional demethylmenaquinone methyltransferase/2-methoxy-6-polyprenyl-1,4-benzoquinol methylase UbiE [Bacteroidota bacterium]
MSTSKNLAVSEMKAKGKPLQKMFNQVPSNYDFLNRLLTFRLDEIWRKKAAKAILKENPDIVMDMGTGTGDLAVRLAKKKNDIQVTGYDFSGSMLDVARKKAKKYSLENVSFIEGDAAEMPFQDNYFDIVGISFAFRNITFKNPNTYLYLSEVLRVLKPGGKFVIVESSQPKNKIIRAIFHAYFNYIVSGLGGKLSKSKGAYHYLAYSAKNFYTPGELEALLVKHGFSSVKHKPMFFGASALTVAGKSVV